MAKRRLTKQQQSRIAQRHSKHVNNPTIDVIDDSFGPEKNGLIIAHHGKQVEVEPEQSDESTALLATPLRVRCHIRANLETLVTGDKIVFQQGEQSAVVTALHPRSSTLKRPDKYGKLKPIAANIDQLIITIAPLPEPHSGLIDRYIAVAENASITPVLVFNKTDLYQNSDDETVQKSKLKIERYKKRYHALGYTCLDSSAKKESGNITLLETLTRTLKDKTSVFVGQSGVGKSSIIKALLPDQKIAIGELSSAVIKGKHTTTHSELFHFKFGGSCIDSPGIREFGLWHLSQQDVAYGFKEIRELSQYCKFRNCQHEGEPKCAVLEAKESGKMDAKRLENYFRIIHSLDDFSVH